MEPFNFAVEKSHAIIWPQAVDRSNTFGIDFDFPLGSKTQVPIRWKGQIEKKGQGEKKGQVE